MHYIKGLFNKYGVFLFISIAAVIAKVVAFYYLMNVTANFVLICAVTLVIILLIFDVFKNKYIPLAIYFLISVLMFADVSYSSFFNRYLSVSMIGAADLLVGVTESIKEIIKPKFFLLFVDNLILLITFIYASYRHRTKFDDINGDEILIDEKYIKAHEKKINRNIPDANDNNKGEGGNNTNKDSHQKQSNSSSKGKKKGSKSKKKQGEKMTRSIVDCALVVFIICTVIFNITGSYALMSVSNRELFSYYTKDVLEHWAGLSLTAEPEMSKNEIYTGTYESQKDGPLFGVAKGRNLIVIQVESLQDFVIGAEYNGTELTPNLNNLIEDDTIYFDNFYQQVSAGNTSDAEYAINNGLYGSMIGYTYLNYTENYLKGLPVMLRDDYGYSTAVFHAYERNFWNRENFYPAEGFDKYYSEEDYSHDDILGMGLSDKSWYKESVEYMKNLQSPFYSFLITLSNHHPYYLPEESTEVTLLPEDKGTTFGHYLQTVNYTDYAIGCFINDLKEAGLYDNSIICIYGDHHGLTVEDKENVKTMSRYLGKEYSYDTMMNIPLLIHIPGTDVKQTISTIGGQTDFLPTVASLLGFEKLDTLYIGQNLLTADSGFVSEFYYVNKGSYFDDDTMFLMSGDGVFFNSEAYNRHTGERIPVESCMDGYLKSLNQINSCEFYLRKDVLRKIYLENYSMDSIIPSDVNVTNPAIIANAGAPDSTLVGTNSLEALNASYEAGYRTIKVDLSWTSDGRTILLSDWTETKDLFSEKMLKTTYDTFMSAQMKKSLTQMDFEMLSNWMTEHPDASIALDVNEDMGYLLQTIERFYPAMKDRIIPIFSNISDYNRGDLMGFENKSIYKIEKTTESTQKEIDDFIAKTNLWAVALPKTDNWDKYSDVIKNAQFAYLYDIDETDAKSIQDYKNAGISGFITNTTTFDDEKAASTQAEEK